MKRVIIAAILFFVCSCRKDVRVTPGPGAAGSPDGYLRSVMGHLRDSVGVAGFNLLDTSLVYSGGPNVLRIGYRGKAIASEFLLVRTDSSGNVLGGRMVRLSLDVLSGSIETRSFSGAVVMSSGIESGVIGALQPRQGVSRTIVEGKTVTTLPAPDADWLPEVVVVGYGGGAAGTPYMAFDGVVGSPGGGDSGRGVAGGVGFIWWWCRGDRWWTGWTGWTGFGGIVGCL
ncbi:hypothetical protein ACQ86N_25190 [Puia sp. P3]|uniref:hypothetical protein n=1 Tax=Puia sp. P3 TaxID=3423952 RepID=UPI003D669169